MVDYLSDHSGGQAIIIKECFGTHTFFHFSDLILSIMRSYRIPTLITRIESQCSLKNSMSHKVQRNNMDWLSDTIIQVEFIFVKLGITIRDIIIHKNRDIVSP